MRISRTVVCATALGVALVLCIASMVLAQTPPLPVENHYQVYTNGARVQVVRPVELTDQFGRINVSDLMFDRFATPAEKRLPDGTTFPIVDASIHMDWWQIAYPQPQRSVVVTDQFGQSVWTLGAARYLLLPSLKNTPPPDPKTGLPVLPTWNHYLCYDVLLGPLVNQPVILIDQFGQAQVAVRQARYFCNPVQKLDNGKIYPILDPTAHLAVYDISAPGTFQHVTALDQFGYWQASAERSELLCVPALKDYPVRTEQTTWGRVKALYQN